jgi:hypothetical protein
MGLKTGERELQKCTLNRKVRFFTTLQTVSLDRFSCAAGILFQSLGEGQLPSAPPMLRVMHDHSSGNTGNYD